KLLGVPQAGILLGKPEIVRRLRRNPMFRALRVDKTIYQILEHTLRNLLLERWDEVPVVRMIRLEAREIRARAESLVRTMEGGPAGVVDGTSVIGGGSTPEQALPTFLIAIKCEQVAKLERLLRCGDPPVVARIGDEQLLLDLRTVLPEEEPLLVKALVSAMR